MARHSDAGRVPVPGPAPGPGPTDLVTVALCGDVMPGRGVDQILPHPGDPTLVEEYLRDARDYVRAAERVSGPIASPVDFSWPWGSALRAMDEAGPDARVINLETSVTRSGDFAPGKAVHYRMSPGNLPVLSAGRPDVCALANNHVLDFGRAGLAETLDALSGAGLRTVGAGRDADEASRPAVAGAAGSGARVVVFGYAAASSGVPSAWAATRGRSGVNLLPDLSDATAAAVVERVEAERGRHGKATTGARRDVVVVSVHWGSNWGYGVSRDQVRFAHRLIDGGVDIVHGHSSHHPRPIEIYREKLILHGCGDFIDDYEGIGGYEEYRDDLRLLYLPSVEPETGRLAALRMPLMRARRMRLEPASRTDCEWLRTVLARCSRRFETVVAIEEDGTLVAGRA